MSLRFIIMRALWPTTFLSGAMCGCTAIRARATCADGDASANVAPDGITYEESVNRPRPVSIFSAVRHSAPLRWPSIGTERHCTLGVQAALRSNMVAIIISFLAISINL